MMRNRPAPLYFGPPGAGLFGWLHGARLEHRASLALVVCNPFGFEEICAHRSLRMLADGAAAAGVPSLRFDLAGCGNSEGDEFAPDRLGAWLRSVHDAIDALKQATGVTRVCLLGMRLGACLAALAAAQRDDVCGLVAIAPVVRGRDFVRELRMLAESTAPTDGQIESAGFVMTAQTAEALRSLDLLGLPKAPAPRVLIVERDDLPGSGHWQDALTQAGVAARTETWPGYAAIMSNPQDAQPPQRIIDGVLATLAEWRDAMGDAPRAGAAGGELSAHAATLLIHAPTAVRERAVAIPVDDVELFGVLTAPVGAPRRRRAVLMLNSGSVHHIGPNRLWVTLARRWAARGTTVLRIDLSGIGDSPAHAGAPQNRVYSAEAARDIAAALAWLRREGIGECHLLGLCSGAFHALQAAAAGQAIASAVMINPLTYGWTDCVRLGHALNEHEILELSKKYRRQVFSLSTWRRLLRGELDLRLIAGVIRGRARETLRAWAARGRRAIGQGPSDGVEAHLASAARHGIAMHFVFGEGASGLELLRKQAGHALDGLRARAQMSIDLIPGADHTFTRLAARERLIERLDALLPSRAEAKQPVTTTSASRQPPAPSGLRASANATTAALPTTARTSSISR